MRDLFPEKQPRTRTRAEREDSDSVSRFDSVYDYLDAEGVLRYQVVRTRPKGFFQRRPNGSGGWINGLGDQERLLYRLPEVMAAVERGVTVLLMEGEKDVEAARACEAELSFVATTAPMGAGKWRSSYSEALRGAKVLVCGDNDAAGRAHASHVSWMLQETAASVAVRDVTRAEPRLRGVKGADVSDLLALHEPREALRALLEDRRVEGLADAGAVATLLLAEGMGESYPATGLKGLDEALSGLYPGLHVLGALSSAGKTALAAQIAGNLAEAGVPVAFFCLEMGEREMLARMTACTAFLRDPARYRLFSSAMVLEGREGALEAVTAYRESGRGKGLYFCEGDFAVGAEEVASFTRRVQRKERSSPVVIVDYLQILRAEGGDSDKQAADRNVVALKRLARELDTPVLAISSFNRASYGGEATLAAFKESGGIEYSADTVMALQAQQGEGMREGDARRMELVILKNRRGRANLRVPLSFYPAPGAFVCERGK